MRQVLLFVSGPLQPAGLLNFAVSAICGVAPIGCPGDNSPASWTSLATSKAAWLGSLYPTPGCFRRNAPMDWRLRTAKMGGYFESKSAFRGELAYLPLRIAQQITVHYWLTERDGHDGLVTVIR